MKDKAHWDRIAKRSAKRTAEANARYGDSGVVAGNIMLALYPDGIPPQDYDIALILLRIADKMARIVNRPDDEDEDPALDIIGYGMIMIDIMDARRLEQRNIKPKNINEVIYSDGSILEGEY